MLFMRIVFIVAILVFAFGCLGAGRSDNKNNTRIDNINISDDNTSINKSNYLDGNSSHIGCKNYCLESEINCKNWNISGEYPNCHCLCMDNIRKIDMIVRKWVYEPDPIYVKIRVPVFINLTNIDEYQAHGFYSPDFGISEILEANQTKMILIVPNKTGRIVYYSSDSPGYGGISGTMVVEEN